MALLGEYFSIGVGAQGEPSSFLLRVQEVPASNLCLDVCK
jgi:hypothetical protein